MACKNCTKNGVRTWLMTLGLVLLIIITLTGFIGAIAVWHQSWDGYDYIERDYVSRYMNWLPFNIFSGLFICGITTVFWIVFSEEKNCK